MPAAPTPPARHARLFELIRQGNLITRAQKKRLTAPPPKVDMAVMARKAARSLSR